MPTEKFEVMPLNPDFRLVKLADGTLFAAEITVQAWQTGGPLLEITLKVKNGQPALTYFGVRAGSDDDAEPLRPFLIRALPVARIVEHVMKYVATVALMRDRFARENSPWDLSVDELGKAEEMSARLGRRRPMTDPLLQQVANIVRDNQYDPRRKVAETLFMSNRTASRWIAEARRRGLLEESAMDSSQEEGLSDGA